MPKTITTEAYEFDELDDAAKEKARDWYRECLNYEGDWWEFDDFVSVAACIGIEFDQNMRTITVPGGSHKTIDDGPKISFSGFCSQGDGCSFEGSYSCKPDAVAAIKAYAPEDRTLHNIAERLMSAQQAHLFGLHARIHRISSSYCHEYTVGVDVTNAREDHDDVDEGIETDITEAMRDFMRWMYRQLEAQSDDRYCDETVDENIRCNEYLFTKEGRRHEYA